MEDKESETNTSSFPLFNLEALKQGFPNMPNIHPIPLNVPSTQDFFVPTEGFKPKDAKESESQPVNKKRGRKPKKKNLKDVESLEATMKEILENELTGVPMEADVKMKEQKLEKMREGKARKKKGQTANSSASEESKKEAENIINMKSVGGESQTLFGLDNNNMLLPAKRVVIKGGKPVLEDVDTNFSEDPTKRQGLQVVANTKPQKISSMSFRKKNHTKQWAEEETRKFYKALELFGTEFSLISKLFPSRDRTQMKNKLRKEEKENPAKVEETLKRHELSHRNSLIQRIGRTARKELKTDADQLPHLEHFGTMSRNDSRYRSISNCSLDSMDMKIVDDLKGIFTKEIQPATSDPFNIQAQLRKEPLVPQMKIKSDKDDEDVESLNVSPDSTKENKESKSNVVTIRPLEKEQNPQKTNLLLGLLKK